MFPIAGTRRSYHWGSTDVIPGILRIDPDGEPYAEHWFGSHPLGDSLLPGSLPLSEHLRAHPEQLGEANLDQYGVTLPYLVKFLSAGTPLSLQAHPSRQQAELGYARESLQAKEIDAPDRCFKDDWPKPELIVALTAFDGLVGFRSPRETVSMFEALGVMQRLEPIMRPLWTRETTPALQQVFLSVLTLDRDQGLVEEVVSAAVRCLDMPGRVGDFARTAVELDEHFPGDPGILAALLLHRFHLEPGEAVFLPTGVMHTYLRGTAIEVMANSDNVLRGGLTSKHIDVDSLLEVVDFTPTDVTVLTATGHDGLYHFETPTEEFQVWLVQPMHGPAVKLPDEQSARICIAIDGSIELVGETNDRLRLERGEAAFIGAAEHVTAVGSGQMYVTAGAR